MVFVDDSHATGFMGKTGRGTHEHCGVFEKIDVITTTLGKALGGASGGCVSGRRELVETCHQRARLYLFSNAVAPVIVAGALKVLDLISSSTDRRDKLEWNFLVELAGDKDWGHFDESADELFFINRDRQKRLGDCDRFDEDGHFRQLHPRYLRG